MAKRSEIRVVPSDEGAVYGLCEQDTEQIGGCAGIRADNLSLKYGSTAALLNVTVAIKPCSITALVGPSGCGKTSFLHCLNRLVDLIPSATVSGDIQIGKLSVFDPNCDLIALRRRVGLIFQNPTPFPFSIRKNFDLPLKEHGVRDRREREFAMEQALRDVGLWDDVKDRLSKSAIALSGGQQQRLCIARAIALKPEVLLLDEPCSALDPISSGVVEELICSLRGNFTLVVVTHNLAQARRIADEVAVFWVKNEAGVLIESGATEDVFCNPTDRLTAAYVQGVSG